MTHLHPTLRSLEIEAVTCLVARVSPIGPVTTLIEVGCEEADDAPHQCRCLGLVAAAHALAERGVQAQVIRYEEPERATATEQSADVVVASYVLGRRPRPERRDLAAGLWGLVGVGGRLAVLEELAGPATGMGTNELVDTMLDVSAHGVSIDDVTVLRADPEESRWAVVTMRRLGPVVNRR